MRNYSKTNHAAKGVELSLQDSYNMGLPNQNGETGAPL